MPIVNGHHHRRPGVLRIASHNIQGNLSAFGACVQAWQQRKFDIVALQEVHALPTQLNSTMKLAAEKCGFRLVFSVCKRNPRSAGVAFLVSSAVCAQLPTRAPRLVTHDGGRMVCLHLNWGGRSLWFVNAYMPCQPDEAVVFIQEVLQPRLNSPPPGRHTSTILLGDWNFVHNPHFDRMRVEIRNHAPTPNDLACPAPFATAAPNMIDTFRSRHPRRRVVTHASRHGGARLDRIYVRHDLLPFVVQAGVMNVHEYFSDHRPVFVHVAAAEGLTVRGRDMPPRVRLLFYDDPVLRHMFTLWISVRAEQAPAGGHDVLIKWWDVFKEELVEHVRELNQLHRQHTQPPQELQSGRDTVAKEIIQCWEKLEAAEDDAAAVAAVQLLHETRRKWASILNAVRRHGDNVQPHLPWLHYNEVPNKVFTAAMKPPRASSCVHALRHPQGHLLGPGKGQANLMVQHYASISTAPAVEPAALQQVLDAIPAHGPTGLSTGDADALGHAIVTAAEVRKALKHSKPGTSPGPDSIPVELYRKAGQPMIVLLAKVLSAMGESNCVPPNFLDGAITSIHKADDPTLPSNYRPITVLNTDYRILAKVLANRCMVHIPRLISREQCAFLKGRNIGDSIMLLQLLPHQLAAQRHKGALVAFLDFKKAYDSVNREFLRHVLLAMGVGDKFVNWVMLLLGQGTTACAVLNGFKSDKVRFQAGVRQGCPLAPLLYLFVGEALLRFMKAQPQLGVDVAGARCMAAQFADDVDPVLKGVEEVHVLVNTMRTFAQASNQHVNVSKSKLLPVGTPPDAPLPAAIAGIPVAESATTLGITFHAGLGSATPKHDWHGLQEKITSKLNKLGRLPLSVFGRAMGASTYALSKTLFYLEHTGLPTAAQLDVLDKALAKLVDRANNNRSFTYVRKELLLGPAKHGGFGMLGVKQHILARHAVWAVKLVTGDVEVPWIRVGRSLLSNLWGVGWHAMLPLMPSAQAAPDASHAIDVTPMPAPLARIFSALHELPTAQDVQIPHLALGPWCASAPLVGNPWLHNAQGDVMGRDSSDALLLLFRCLSVGGLAHFLHFASVASEEEWRGSTWCAVPRQLALQHAHGWLRFVPNEWLSEGLSAPAQPHPPTQPYHAAARTLMQRLGWKVPNDDNRDPTATVVVPLASLSVRMAYRMLLQPVVEKRVERWKAFIAEARDLDVAAVDGAHVQLLRGLLATIWRQIKWSNNRKVLYWQICVNGLPTSTSRNTGRACYCDAVGHMCPDRKHHLWDCPVAAAVVAELCRCVGVAQLQRHHVWLMQPPDGFKNVHNGASSSVQRVMEEVWIVVCLAALQAMWHTAKKVMGPDTRPGLAAQPRGLHVVATQGALAHFWDLLHEFAQGAKIPGSWRRLLPRDMPFLHFPHVARRLQVNNVHRLPVV
jgi:exonuclease III